MIKKLLAGAVVAAFAFSSIGPAAAQRDFSKINVKTINVADGIHMLMGAGGNVGLSVGDDGIFMVDDQFAPMSEKLMAAIKAISDKPVNFLLNTHWHFDHTGGNENFAKTGAVIVAHENVRKLMSADQFMKAFNRPVPAAPKAAWPIVTFAKSVTFHMNGQTISVDHLENAHTGGDSFVYFKEADVIHTGDTFFNGFYPFIDVQHGGSVQGMIAAADKMIAMAGPNTKIIPGHGPLADRKQLMEFRDMLKTVQSNVAAAMSGGKSVEDVIAAKPTAATDEKWGGGFLKPNVFTRIVYSSLSK